MGLVRKGENEKQRKRMAMQSMKDLMQIRAAAERNPPFKGEQICKNCGFKARYKFFRCPECNHEQEIQK